jgi:hypothetical protein
VPVVGEIADGANAAWYAAEGDYLNAGLSAAAMVPFVGWAATGGKLGVKAYKAVHTVDGAKAWLKDRPSMVPRNATEAPWKDQPAPDRAYDRVIAPNPLALGDPTGDHE